MGAVFTRATVPVPLTYLKTFAGKVGMNVSAMCTNQQGNAGMRTPRASRTALKPE